MNIATSGPQETEALGFRLGRNLRGKDVLCLVGDLGSGKTTLTRGIARGAGFKGDVASPTFVLVKVYKTKKIAIYHIDLYRIAENETAEIGLEEYLSDSHGACVIEWPQAAHFYFPKDRLEIRFSHLSEPDRRNLIFHPHGSRARALLASAAPELAEK